MIEKANELGDYLIAIVNNDKQLLLRKGKVTLHDEDRCRVLSAIKHVDEVVLSIDEQLTVEKTLTQIAEKYQSDELVFVNGGNRDSQDEVPEKDICRQLGIEMVFTD